MPEVSDPTHISEHNISLQREALQDSYKKYGRRSVGYTEGRELCLVMWEGAAEGGADDWGEVVTR